MGKIRTLGIGALLGGLGAYAVSHSERAGRAVGARVYGMSSRGGARIDDVTLTQKVESELYGPEPSPKERVSVNTANGVVQLRGEVQSRELIDDLVERARRVRGVKDVENLLHTPGSDAPMHR